MSDSVRIETPGREALERRRRFIMRAAHAKLEIALALRNPDLLDVWRYTDELDAIDFLLGEDA